jgi:DNA-binding CsgD family transcriptional regulator
MASEPSKLPSLPHPRGLRARAFSFACGDYLVLSYPLGGWVAPLGLTRAERAVVEAVLRGASNAEIARSRGTSPRTVANQLASIYEKLGVRTRYELVRRLAIQDASRAGHD